MNPRKKVVLLSRVRKTSVRDTQHSIEQAMSVRCTKLCSLIFLCRPHRFDVVVSVGFHGPGVHLNCESQDRATANLLSRYYEIIPFDVLGMDR